MHDFAGAGRDDFDMTDYVTPRLAAWRRRTDAPLLILAIGSLPLLLLEVTRADGPAIPAGWHADPSGRHQYRWWNGQSAIDYAWYRARRATASCAHYSPECSPPVLFGDQRRAARPLRSRRSQCHRRRVVGGRGWARDDGNAFYRDLARASLVVGARYLAIA
jgi:hypothetical protein